MNNLVLQPIGRKQLVNQLGLKMELYSRDDHRYIGTKVALPTNIVFGKIYYTYLMSGCHNILTSFILNAYHVERKTCLISTPENGLQWRWLFLENLTFYETLEDAINVKNGKKPIFKNITLQTNEENFVSVGNNLVSLKGYKFSPNYTPNYCYSNYTTHGVVMTKDGVYCVANDTYTTYSATKEDAKNLFFGDLRIKDFVIAATPNTIKVTCGTFKLVPTN